MTRGTIKRVERVEPVLWEITCETAAGHRVVHRVRAVSEADALAQLPPDAPEVVEVR